MQQKKKLTLGLLAHVDAGKTTLSEALLYESGATRNLGRVDHADAFLDTHELERARGITIFSKPALLDTPHRQITLLDTPGHVDFSPEMERVLPVLDCAVLVISGTAGVQAHTITLWELLKKHGIPTIIFISKMDLPGKSSQELMAEFSKQLGTGFVDMGLAPEEICEQAALCDEALLASYLETGTVTPGNFRELIAHRLLFPCIFGSGLKLDGVRELLALLDLCSPETESSGEFGASVFKISRDLQGCRLTWLKLTGGTLRVRSALSYQTAQQEPLEEKIQQLRIYDGEKFTSPDSISPGTVCAVTGLSSTYAGQGLGTEPGAPAPTLEPVMTYGVCLPKLWDPLIALPQLRQLEEEEPQLHIVWEEATRSIRVQLMGKVQLEIFKSLVKERFDREITLDQGRIYYKETILEPVEGIGHFEPLRHYAEVHILLEPLPQGSGIVLDTLCPGDVLDGNFQNLVLTHLGEKTHLGVLTGSPLTDVKLTLLVGKAHPKHTEGGDFRQATYRAVRQGLMKAESVLLEPFYQFALRIPGNAVGRAITDIRAMGGEPEAPEQQGEFALLEGLVPAAELGDYAQQVAAYTQGRGQLQISLKGYLPCHNSSAVIEAMAYDPERDLENTPDSVFCAHGAGFPVKWNQVEEFMHLESPLKKPEQEPVFIARNIQLDDRELEAIMEREFGPIKRPLYRTPVNPSARQEVPVQAPRKKIILVDGYNMIFAWKGLKAQAGEDLDAARRRLCDLLSSYAAYRGISIILVFDGYKAKGNPGEKGSFHNIQLVYTPEGQTADAYLQSLAQELGGTYAVSVATSDSLVQLSSLGSGVLRMSARELENLVEEARKEMSEKTFF